MSNLKCKECKGIFKERDFYKSIGICKSCVTHKSHFEDESKFIIFLKENDLPFMKNVYTSVKNTKEYLRNILGLSQYKNRKFSESQFTKNVEEKEDDKDFNDNVIDFLKQEELLLRKKANKMLDQGDFNMYTKLINAYETVVALIKQYDFKQMYSEYATNCEKQVAIWEQNGDGLIRDHKAWNVGRSIAYIDYYKKNENSIVFLLYYLGKVYKFDGWSSNEITNTISNIIKENKVDIYIDSNGYGIAICDEFDQLGISYKKVKHERFQ